MESLPQLNLGQIGVCSNIDENHSTSTQEVRSGD